MSRRGLVALGVSWRQRPSCSDGGNFAVEFFLVDNRTLIFYYRKLKSRVQLVNFSLDFAITLFEFKHS